MRFRLRTLLIITLLFGALLAAFVWRRERAQAQADLVRRIESAGAGIAYDFEYVAEPDGTRARRVRQVSPYPQPFLDLLGRDFCHTARYLQTPLELPERFDTFDRNILQEALATGPDWWELYLCSHTLRRDDLERVAHQQALENLFFDRVLLPEQDLRPLAPLPSLKSLGFRIVSLSDCDLSVLAEFPNLQNVSFTHCAISNAQLDKLPRLERLTRFDIDELPAGGTDYRWLRSLPNLETLWLQNTELGDPDIAHLASLAKLRQLRMNRSHFTGRIPADVHFPRTLEFLDVSESPLEACNWVSDLQKLKLLSLADTKLTPDALHEVEWPASLESLILTGLKVDEVVLDRLEKLPTLGNLFLSQSLVEPEHVTAFKGRRADCKVMLKP